MQTAGRRRRADLARMPENRPSATGQEPEEQVTIDRAMAASRALSVAFTGPDARPTG
jgi:hypothetical protein